MDTWLAVTSSAPVTILTRVCWCTDVHISGNVNRGMDLLMLTLVGNAKVCFQSGGSTFFHSSGDCAYQLVYIFRLIMVSLVF